MQNLLDYPVNINMTSGVLITYGAPEATSDNYAFLAHVEFDEGFTMSDITIPSIEFEGPEKATREG
jgi:hypothetical protein